MFPIKQQQQQKITKTNCEKNSCIQLDITNMVEVFYRSSKIFMETSDCELKMTVKFMREGANFSFKYWSTKYSTLTLLMPLVHVAYLTLRLFLALGLSKSRTLSQ